VDAASYCLIYTFFDYWNHRLLAFSGRLAFASDASFRNASFTVIDVPESSDAVSLEPFIRVWPLAVFNFSLFTAAEVALADYFYQMLVHADVKWTWGWFGRWILISPVGHRIHHSPLVEHHDKNFSILVLWDRLFGTWYDGGRVNAFVGIAEDVHNRRWIVRDLIEDMGQFLYRVFRLRA